MKKLRKKKPRPCGVCGRRHKTPHVGRGPLDFVSVVLAAASGRLPLDAMLAYVHGSRR